MAPQETEDIQWFRCDPPVLHSQVESCLQHQLHLHIIIRSAVLLYYTPLLLSLRVMQASHA